MLHRFVVVLAVFAVSLPAAAGYRTASDLLDAMLDAEREAANPASEYGC